MTTDEQRGQRLRRLAAALAALLVLAGVAALVVGLTSQVHAPQPAAPVAAQASSTSVPGPPSSPRAAESSPGTPARSSGPAVASGGVPALPAAAPTHVTIPSIGVSSDLLQLAQNPDGTVEVPPLAKNSQAGWYRYSPTPGEPGPSVLLGHVDSAEYGAGVFFKLGALHPGDTVQVLRADHTAATFSITRVTRYPKDAFPTLEVYGNTDDPELRLITCGGAFNTSTHSYLDNIVVYAVLTGSSPA